MKELEIFHPRDKSQIGEEQKPINFFNRKIIQHELYISKTETVSWQHAKNSTERYFMFFAFGRTDSFQIVKIKKDLFSIQVNSEIIETKFNMTQMIEILTDFYSGLRKKLSVENFSNNTEKYIREMNETDDEINKPQSPEVPLWFASKYKRLLACGDNDLKLNRLRDETDKINEQYLKELHVDFVKDLEEECNDESIPTSNKKFYKPTNSKDWVGIDKIKQIVETAPTE